ncbi:MAG: hypothetical protein ACK55I_10735, partial [bacterium]
MATWDIASGLQSNYEDILPKDDLAMDQLDILQWFEDQAMPTNDFLVLVLKDYHRFLGVDGQVGQVESKVIRALRNISQESATKQKAIVILSPSLHIPQ